MASMYWGVQGGVYNRPPNKKDEQFGFVYGTERFKGRISHRCDVVGFKEEKKVFCLGDIANELIERFQSWIIWRGGRGDSLSHPGGYDKLCNITIEIIYSTKQMFALQIIRI